MKYPTKKILLNIDRSWAFGMGFMTGFIKYCRLYTNWELIENLPFYLNKPTSFSENALNADGIVTPASFLSKMDQHLLNKKFAVVFPTTESPFTNAINIITNNDHIGKMAGNYFINKGYKNFAFFGYHSMKWSIEREKAFVNFISKAGYNVNRFEKNGSETNSKNESKRIYRWLISLPKPIAVFGCNDERAKNLIEIVRQLNFKIPYDIAILGVDNDEYLCNTTAPSVSSIQLNIEMIGYKAAELLENAFKKKDHSFNMVPVDPIRVVTRESTDAFAISDQSILQSLEFIKRNSRELIQGSDVAEYVGLSRRHLDHKFKETLGLTVSEHIRKSKINLICAMLIESNEKISTIAQKVGFLETDHFSRFFFSQTGSSPTQYRETNRH